MNKITLTADCRWSELTPEMQLQIVRFINHAASWPGADLEIRQALQELCERAYFTEEDK